MSITFAAAERLWLLTTPHSAYALRLADDDTPTHLYWGEPLDLADVTALTGDRPEIAVEAGAYFGPRSIEARFTDGTTALEWVYAGQDVDGDHLAIRLADRHYPLALTLHYRVHPGSDVIERWTTVANTGGDPITVSRLDSACWSAPRLPDYRASHVVGGWSHEHQVHRTAVPIAETVLTSRTGTRTVQANPWVMIDAGDADETHGDVWSTALAWSGSWRITVLRDPAQRVSWTGGFGHDGLTWHLAPGEVLDTPVFAGLFSSGGFGGTSRAWHAYTRSHVLPTPGEQLPVLYNSWEATTFDVDEAGQRKLADLAADLGVELFVMDDGWFGARRDDHAGLGDWQPYPAAFPRGLRPLADHVHGLGMRFGIWVEPEMVNEDSDLYRAHPDWVVRQNHRRRTEIRNQLVLDFGRPDVAAWALDWLDRLVADNAVDYLKWDCNRPFTEAGRPGDADPDRVWIEHTQAVYRIMAELRSRHPALRIESCASGGGRTDLGVLAHTDEVWTSDDTDAADRIAIQHGFSQLYPARTMSAWVTDCPNPTTARTTPLTFRFHVAMAGVLGIGGDLTSWSADDLTLATSLIATYREIRPVVQHGTQYRLVHGPELTAVQYVGDAETVVFGWRISEPYGRTPAPVRLSGLDPVATYQDERDGTVHTGASLHQVGIDVALPRGDHASVLIRLRRVS
ncbi:MAG TPA: alpha-galactosidase [Pseudonocardiaceae bacterium]|nr:alpha-galactosidase [Pseudonocardiaceae bacterium]